MEKCQVCNGTGQIYCDCDYDLADYCPKCNNIGFTDCNECWGEGEVESE